MLALTGSVDFNDGTVFNSGFGGSCRVSGGTAVFRGNSLVVAGPLVLAGGTVAGHMDGTGTVNGGIVDWSGSTLSGTLTFGPTANVHASGGSGKILAPNAVVRNAGTFSWQAGSIVGNGNATFTNLASGTFNAPAGGYFDYNSGGNIFTNSGTLNIGASPGTVTFSAPWSFVQGATGRLNIEIGGTGISQFDRLLCNGPVSLGGRMTVSLINNFLPAIGNTFDVLTYASRTGEFAIFDSPQGFFSRTYNPGALRLVSTDAPANLEEGKAFYFGMDAPESGDDADPDLDGIANLLEFALGGNPLRSSSSGEKIESPTGGFLEFYYQRNSIAVGQLMFQVRYADNPTGNWQTTGVTETVVGVNGLQQTVQALVPAGSKGCRFVHLQVARP